MKEEMTSLIIMVLLISFLGFVLENIWLALTKGYMDNRNMTMPFLLGYGLLVVGMYMLLGTPEKMSIFGRSISEGRTELVYFALSAVIVSAGEIVLGKIVEHFMGFEYWNYEWIPLHITRYTSVPTSLGFASIITLFMEHVFPVVMDFTKTIYSKTLSDIAVLLLFLCLVDMVSSFKKMKENNGNNQRWKWGAPEKGGIFSYLH